MLPPLTALQAFEAVARRRSFALAAGELHVTPSAISHQIRRLESFLGLKLFERTSRQVRLSAEGELFMQRISGALGAIAAAASSARKGMRSSLYVHSSPSFATLWLMPRIGRFTAQHPQTSLYLSSSTQHSNFELGQVDLDIRYGTRNWPGLTVEPLFVEPICPLASAAFLKRHPIRRPGDLLHVPLIQSTVSVVQWSDWFSRSALEQMPDQFALRFDRAFMAIEAAVQGLGVALESTVLAAGALKQSRLRPIFADRLAIKVQAHFAVYPGRNAERPAVSQFLDWLRTEAASV